MKEMNSATLFPIQNQINLLLRRFSIFLGDSAKTRYIVYDAQQNEKHY